MKEEHGDWCSAHSPPLVYAPYCPAEGHKEDGDTPAMAWHRPAPSSVGTKLRRWCGFLTLNESDDCPNKDASGQSWRRQWCGRAQTSSCLPWTLRRVQAGTKISVCVIFCSNPVTLHWHDCGTAAFPPRCRHIIPWRLNVYECANIRKIFLNTHRKRTKKTQMRWQDDVYWRPQPFRLSFTLVLIAYDISAFILFIQIHTAKADDSLLQAWPVIQARQKKHSRAFSPPGITVFNWKTKYVLTIFLD